MLPDINGYEVLRQIRSAKINIPVLILSGLDTPEEKIKGLGAGADDYLSKPFNRGELMARVRAIIRRSEGQYDSTIKVHELMVDTQGHMTKTKDKIIHLTSKEQYILEILIARRGKVITKEYIMNQLYDADNEPDPKIIDVFVCKLRKKLADCTGGFNYIETIWGRGYAFKEPA
jgi:two-component system cell cycle response regulator CtrA